MIADKGLVVEVLLVKSKIQKSNEKGKDDCYQYLYGRKKLNSSTSKIQVV